MRVTTKEMTKFQSKIALSPNAFLFGMASVFDLSSSLHDFKIPRCYIKNDVLAIMSDWATVGEEIRTAIKNYECKKASQNTR